MFRPQTHVLVLSVLVVCVLLERVWVVVVVCLVAVVVEVLLLEPKVAYGATRTGPPSISI